MKKTVTITEKNESWIRLCEYIKQYILRYDDNQAFPEYLAIKLQGLKRGQYIGNNNQVVKANYSNDVIYYACVMNRQFITDYIDTHHIQDEQHLINLTTKLIKGFLNDAYKEIKNREARKDYLERQKFDNQSSEATEYTPKTEKKSIEKDMW